jgi:hypothetical protein
MSLRRRKLKCLSRATNIDKGYLCTSTLSAIEGEFEDTKEIIRIRKSKKTTQGPKGQTTIYKTGRNNHRNELHNNAMVFYSR